MTRAQVDELLGKLAPIEKEFDEAREWLFGQRFGDDFDSNELLNRFSKANNAFMAVKRYVTLAIEVSDRPGKTN